MQRARFCFLKALCADDARRWACRRYVAAALCAFLAACSADERNAELDKPLEQLYSEATKAYEDGDFTQAAKSFEEVERQYPYSEWATRAQLIAAYAEYQGGDYDSAVATLDRFIQLHPGHADIGYAYYLRALCFYDRIANVTRDQSNTRQAARAFQDIITRFPNTAYATDAQAKIVLVQDQLAAAEMEVGRYYLKQKIYSAALPRFQTVIEKFQTTSQVPEALHRMVECYLALGINKEAQAVAAVLGYNFSGSHWYELSYALLEQKSLQPAADTTSWIGRVWKKIF